MKIKNHPQVIVEIYVDGRHEIHAPAKVKTRRDAITVAALKMGIPAMLRQAPEGLYKPGRYNAVLSDLKLRKGTFTIELDPVK